MSNLNTQLDPDIESYLNYDQSDFTPVSSASDIKSFPSLTHQSSSNGAFASSSTQQAFSGPSYQYDSHRQQTGLPIGGLANTFAVNQASGLHYRSGNNGFVMPTETLNIPLSNLDDFDFNHHQSIDMSDVDYDADSPSDLPAMFFPSGSQNISPAQQAPQRIYPGMHSQQAAQAKAQQEQKRQEMLRQQQQKQLPGQRPLPTQAPKASTDKDPHVEESISRLLSRMRQNSTASAAEDSPTPTSGGSMPRIKKDEDDMDEDERLLASEEGKKLSSKERRQLRNKVSARAFRSRRKEYIGQLEGEVATKVQEANDLRAQNRQLMEENTRLTDLTRMLLSSPAFSGFLQELSNSGQPLNNFMSNPSAQQPQQPTQSVRKDVSSHDAARQMQNQNQNHQMVGMTLIPETTINMDMLETSSWNSVLPSNDFHVFSVTELPEPPKLDLSALSGKKSSDVLNVTKQVPAMPDLPAGVVGRPALEPSKVNESVKLDQQEFDLYYDSEPTSQHMLMLPLPPALSLVFSKVNVASEMTSVAQAKVSESDSWSALSGMCAMLDESCDRLADLLPKMK